PPPPHSGASLIGLVLRELPHAVTPEPHRGSSEDRPGHKPHHDGPPCRCCRRLRAATARPTSLTLFDGATEVPGTSMSRAAALRHRPEEAPNLDPRRIDLWRGQ